MTKLNLCLSLTLSMILTTFAAGCAGRSVSTSSTTASTTPAVTDIVITYMLERSQHRMIVHRDETGAVQIRTTLDGEEIKKSNVDAQRYQSFVAKAGEFLSTAGRAPAQASTSTVCYGPYRVLVIQKGNTQERKGCRNTDDGALSRLVRQGEILLYSKK